MAIRRIQAIFHLADPAVELLQQARLGRPRQWLGPAPQPLVKRFGLVVLVLDLVVVRRVVVLAREGWLTEAHLVPGPPLVVAALERRGGDLSSHGEMVVASCGKRLVRGTTYRTREVAVVDSGRCQSGACPRPVTIKPAGAAALRHKLGALAQAS